MVLSSLCTGVYFHLEIQLKWGWIVLCVEERHTYADDYWRDYFIPAKSRTYLLLSRMLLVLGKKEKIRLCKGNNWRAVKLHRLFSKVNGWIFFKECESNALEIAVTAVSWNSTQCCFFFLCVFHFFWLKGYAWLCRSVLQFITNGNDSRVKIHDVYSAKAFANTYLFFIFLIGLDK